MGRALADGGEPDLRARVTELDTDPAGATLPPTLAGVLLMNVLGHFSASERRGIWDLLAARLPPLRWSGRSSSPTSRPRGA